jgi:TonB family protein
MLKTSVYLTGFYIIYALFLSRDTLYVRNRVFILFSVICSFVLPLITLNINEQKNIFYFGKMLSEIIVTGEASGKTRELAGIQRTGAVSLILKIYFTGIILTGLKLIIDIISLLVLIAQQKEKENHIICFTGYRTAGFSALGYVFINKSLSSEEAQEIIKHEQNHLDQNHFLDILFMEIIQTFQWFNPSIYLFNRSLRAIHEYQADKGYLKSGMPVMRYQSLLLNHVFRSGRFNMTNNFSNPSLIKKRMIMMIKVPSGKLSNLKLVFVIPVAVLLLSVISACEKNLRLSGTPKQQILPESTVKQSIDINKSPVYYEAKADETALPPPPPPPPLPVADKEQAKPSDNSNEIIGEKSVPVEEEAPKEIFVVVEEMPVFNGGDTALMKFINENVQYPASAKEKNITGRVIIRFAVMAKGNVDKISVLKGVDPDLDAEAIRVVKALPEWIPGKQGGKPVNVWYSVPISFMLQ